MLIRLCCVAQQSVCNKMFVKIWFLPSQDPFSPYWMWLLPYKLPKPWSLLRSQTQDRSLLTQSKQALYNCTKRQKTLLLHYLPGELIWYALCLVWISLSEGCELMLIKYIWPSLHSISQYLMAECLAGTGSSFCQSPIEMSDFSKQQNHSPGRKDEAEERTKSVEDLTSLVSQAANGDNAQ